MRYPSSVVLSKRDRVTNIRNKRNLLLFVEEESLDNPATTFGVEGQSPVTDFFGNWAYNVATLKRGDIQP